MQHSCSLPQRLAVKVLAVSNQHSPITFYICMHNTPKKDQMPITKTVPKLRQISGLHKLFMLFYILRALKTTYLDKLVDLQHPLQKGHVQWTYQYHIQSLFLQRILGSPHFVSQIHQSSEI